MSESATILVVDDNAQNRALAQSTLEDEGYRVVLAAGGEEAIAAFTREKADCVLLDVRMPDLDGFTVCARIRALPQGGDTPVLFLTALRDVDTFDQALRAGGDDFLTKPVQPVELVVRVRTALELRRLGAEVREHYELMRKRRDELMRLQLQKERLTAFLVHDLKNPVSSVDLLAQVVLRSPELPARAHGAATQIRAEVKKLIRMISNLLDLARADEKQLSPVRQTLDPRALVDEILSELELTAQARDVTLHASVEIDSLHADEDLLRRTLANLVENAVRHAPAGTRVSVAIRGDGESVELCVDDRGPGVPEEMRAQVFEAFVRLGAEEASGSRAGHGLGLAFCKLAVEAHGGRIWIEDGAPGAVFRVRIPHER